MNIHPYAIFIFHDDSPLKIYYSLFGKKKPSTNSLRKTKCIDLIQWLFETFALNP